MPHGNGIPDAVSAGPAESIDFDQLLSLNPDDLGLLASSPESSALLKSIEMDITPSSFLSEVPPAEDVSYIHTLPPELLAPFQQVAPSSAQAPLFPHHPPQFQHVLAPTHFSPRILPSGSNSTISSSSLPQPPPPQPQPPSTMPADDVAMMMPSDPVAASPFISQPWAPFWTAAPLPFNPQNYPQCIIPAHTEVPLCPPSSNPRAKIFAQRQKPEVPPPVHVPAAASRPEKKRSAATDPAKSALLNQLAELQKRLLSSETESSALREKLSMTQKELAMKKASLKARNSPMMTPPPTPEDAIVPVLQPQHQQAQIQPQLQPMEATRPGSPPRGGDADIFTTASPFKTRTSKQIPAFTEKIDFANIELKKTSSSRVLEAEKISYHDAQHQWQQRLYAPAPSAPPPPPTPSPTIPPPSQPISINPRLLHR